MKIVLFVLCLAVSAVARAAGFAGVFVLEAPDGTVSVTLEERSGQVEGVIDIGRGQSARLSGRAAGRKADGTLTAASGKGRFEASIDGDVLDLVLIELSPTGEPSPPMNLRLARSRPLPPGTVPRDRGGDSRLVGHWVTQNVIVSGGASMASEEHLVFDADGTYAYGPDRSVAGATGWSFEGGSGSGLVRGYWRARGGVLMSLSPARQWARIGTYGMTDDGSTLRIAYDQGGRKLWSRRWAGIGAVGWNPPGGHLSDAHMTPKTAIDRTSVARDAASIRLSAAPGSAARTMAVRPVAGQRSAPAGRNDGSGSAIAMAANTAGTGVRSRLERHRASAAG